MSSIPGLPTQGSDVTVLITRVHLHPLCVLVEFWGKFSQERIIDYESLAKDIQSPGAIFKEFEGNPGDHCLAQKDNAWYRSRIVSRNGSKYSVFLIDKGMTYTATTQKLAWGRKEHFQLPPEVEFCVLANVLPLSSENKWSPVALQFLKSLDGKYVTAHVQDVLVPHRMFILHIPCLSKQMYEMGFVKKLSPVSFRDFVLMSLKSHDGAESPLEIHQLSGGSGDRLHKQELFMYPELPGGTVETVTVTEVTNPQRIFCQLKVFSKELKKLSEKITQNYEGRVSNCIISPDMIGFPCASKGNDGRWYRSVLQQVFPKNKVVEVLHVDYGTKQLVQMENIRPLTAEFFRMPVVTYICSLHGIIDKGVGWTTSQVDFLRSLLLYKTMIAKFEYQSISEGVYYVTLYNDDNTNINTTFGSKESCLVESEKTLGDYAIQSTVCSLQPLSPHAKNTSQPIVEEDEKTGADKPPAEELALNSSHLAVVQHISNPSEFWIQTENYKKEFDVLFDSMHHLYKDSASTHMVRNPTFGLYCAAKAEDGEFYRATVTEMEKTQVTVFFVDYGNTEIVDKSNIRILPPEFRKIPQLALKCSLDGVMPKNGKWSDSALEFFSQAVTDKVLNVHVKSKYSNHYVVELTDPTAQGEKDVSTQMCQAGLAERAEIQRQPTVKGAMSTAMKNPTHLADARLPGVHSNTGISFQQTVGLTSNERRVTTFKEYMFPIGSVLDVSVSCIESPNDFWCQLVQNAGHLKLLMHDLQAHYAGSEFTHNVETACVARHPTNGMWYRALVINKHETPNMDVLFVDYGQIETVSLYDLRRICPEFLTLHGQAFRCSLFSPVNRTSANNEWSEEAKAKFQSFVQTAASNHIILKCTVYAIMYSEQMVAYNIVDLETPFESICTNMASLITSTPLKKATEPSFHLNSYYYSTHNVKTGSEEQVTVTCVNNVSQFYCHLDKNVEVMQNLMKKVNILCQQLKRAKPPTVFGTLCFARYTDGQWYRAQIKTTRPAVLVHFVDYGDTMEVDKSDLLPVPKEANDIMSVPVQAILCGLSDVPANVPSEVNEWFETKATEYKFRALIVAREPDGKLLVELYHGNTKINAKIKRQFQVEVQTKEQIAHQGQKACEASANHSQKTQHVFANQDTATEVYKQAPKKNDFSAPKPTHQMKIKEESTDVNFKTAQKPCHRLSESGQRIRPAPVELYKTPFRRQLCGAMQNNGSEQPKAVRSMKDNQPSNDKQLAPKSPKTESRKENNAEKLPKMTDLPSRRSTPGMTVDVYVSHCDSPLSFYVQCVSEEDEIFSLIEKLSVPDPTSKSITIKDMHPGDLIQAVFEDDSSWYRAVVKEIRGDEMVLVEFVDFGNTSEMPVFKTGRLPQSLLQLPVYSTHCMLSNAAVLGEERVLHSDVVSVFKKDIGCCGEKVLKCQFIRQVGSMWEVSLQDNGVDIVCKVPSGGSEMTIETKVKEEPAQISDLGHEAKISETSPVKPYFLHYSPQKELLVGQQLDVYITTFNDGLTFWCQVSDSEEVNKITLSVSEVGSAADGHIDPDALFPGSPCIAFYSDDQLWYRAEVLNRNGDALSIIFVDYGNKSQVSITDIREIPPYLVQIPPQAFLCELEGFDTLCGSWNSGAEDELSSLTADKSLQLTVSRVTSCDGKIHCFVQMTCEGQIINEAMKTWWKCSKMEDTPDSVKLTSSFEPPLQLDSGISVPEDQLKHPDMLDAFNTAVCIQPQSKCSEEPSVDKLSNSSTSDEALNVPRSSKHYICSEDSLQMESFAMSAKEEDSIEGGNTLPSSESLKDILPSDSAVDETTFLLVDNEDGQDTLFISGNVIVAIGEEADEESTSVVHAHEHEELDSPPKENILEAIDELRTETADTEMTSTYSLEDEPFSDAAEAKSDGEVSRGDSLTSTTAANMAVVSSSHCLPVEHLPVELCGISASQEEGGTGDCSIPEEEEQRDSRTHNDSSSEEGTSAYEEETQSALLGDTDTSISEEHCYAVPSTEMTDELIRSASCAEEAQSADVEESSVTGKVTNSGADCLSSVTAEEMTTCITEDVGAEMKVDLCDTSTAEQSDEVYEESFESPHMRSTDVAQQLEVPSTSICEKDNLTSENESSPRLSGTLSEEEEADRITEDAEECVQTQPPQNKDFDDSVLTDEQLSSADDSFEAQLSKITHLSLIVKDTSADALAKQQPEE